MQERSDRRKTMASRLTLTNIILFVLLFVLTTLVLISPLFQERTGLLRFGILFLLFALVRFRLMKRVDSPTASGAIVMAIGIFINGAIVMFPPLLEVARGLTVSLFILLCFVLYSYAQTVATGRFLEMHLSNPVASFAAGTWVAAISVCSISLSQRVPEWLPFVKVLMAANVVLWLGYVLYVVRRFTVLASLPAGRNVHGVLFLSTVSTQSLVIAAKVAFGRPSWFLVLAPWVIGLGGIFYAISFVLVLRRYLLDGSRLQLDTGWLNTNCIIHGAMSITGLASAVSGVVPTNVVLGIWIWVIAWFIFVEVVEIARAAIRVRRHGWLKGLLVYDPTQWSRNFTFGMFYAFTMHFDIEKSAAAGTFLVAVRDAVLSWFGWVVLILLVVEGVVFFRDRLVLRSDKIPSAGEIT